MKKLLLLAAILAVVFTACPTDDGNGGGNSDVIGTWGDALGEVTLEIGSSNWSFVLGLNNLNGTWTRQGSILTLTRTNGAAFGTATLAQSQLQLSASFQNTEGSDITYTWTLTKGASFQRDAKLTIQNQSSFALMYTRWNSEMFMTLWPSSSESLNVAEGSGYLYITFMTTGNEYRTQESITVSKGENKTFTLLNSTLVIALNDPTNTTKTVQDANAGRDNSDVFGTWEEWEVEGTTGVYLQISGTDFGGTWGFRCVNNNILLGEQQLNGSWTRQGDVLTLVEGGGLTTCGIATLAQGKLTLSGTFLDSQGNGTTGVWNLTKRAE
jgi:hypothetical protein